MWKSKCKLYSARAVTADQTIIANKTCTGNISIKKQCSQLTMQKNSRSYNPMWRAVLNN